VVFICRARMPLGRRRIASSIHDQGEDVDLRVILQEESRRDLEDIEEMRFRNQEGALAAFENFGRIERRPGHTNVNRRDRKRAVIPHFVGSGTVIRQGDSNTWLAGRAGG
jgi:multidrug efflux pump subunit AcrB